MINESVKRRAVILQSQVANAKLVKVSDETTFSGVKVLFFAGASIELLLDSSEFTKSGAVLGINYAEIMPTH